MSNGLLHGYKGIEYVIRAMPLILKEVPDAVYLIHGECKRLILGLLLVYNVSRPSSSEWRKYHGVLRDATRRGNASKFLLSILTLLGEYYSS